MILQDLSEESFEVESWKNSWKIPWRSSWNVLGNELLGIVLERFVEELNLSSQNSIIANPLANIPSGCLESLVGSKTEGLPNYVMTSWAGQSFGGDAFHWCLRERGIRAAWPPD